jgi:hypothetical protein
MSEDDARRAGGDGGAEDGARFDCSDVVLTSYGDHIRARHVVLAVEEERREVLAVGEAQHHVHRSACKLAVGDGGLGEAQ